MASGATAVDARHALAERAATIEALIRQSIPRAA
jgi:hypothetical protein